LPTPFQAVKAASAACYSLKEIITKFAIKDARFHAAVFESSDLLHRDRDRSGQVFPANLFLRGLFGDPS
jgi:hypothetical protein